MLPLNSWKHFRKIVKLSKTSNIHFVGNKKDLCWTWCALWFGKYDSTFWLENISVWQLCYSVRFLSTLNTFIPFSFPQFFCREHSNLGKEGKKFKGPNKIHEGLNKYLISIYITPSNYKTVFAQISGSVAASIFLLHNCFRENQPLNLFFFFCVFGQVDSKVCFRIIHQCWNFWSTVTMEFIFSLFTCCVRWRWVVSQSHVKICVSRLSQFH